jgi:serine/threonine-protein kinase RsbW
MSMIFTLLSRTDRSSIEQFIEGVDSFGQDEGMSHSPTPTGVAPVKACAQAFPAIPSQVREARRFLARLLDDFPAADDALVCLSELASNAIQHTRSGLPGGTFAVHVTRSSECLRVEVHDGGGPWHPQPAQAGERGRGLIIVSALARWGVTGSGDHPRTVWFEMPR